MHEEMFGRYQDLVPHFGNYKMYNHNNHIQFDESTHIDEAALNIIFQNLSIWNAPLSLNIYLAKLKQIERDAYLIIELFSAGVHDQYDFRLGVLPILILPGTEQSLAILFRNFNMNVINSGTWSTAL